MIQKKATGSDPNMISDSTGVMILNYRYEGLFPHAHPVQVNKETDSISRNTRQFSGKISSE
ncbi:hypothetical protein PanWU01x14_046820 [Parasponia andersonii]|uniref:Uncharacterized protein n=1 Tax=Parasponia andersonii TaxID=3476 RepID=A0A2P5DNV1_PARAD|nr:hypothetical protein PanWU01x14_046820 [Parasponia andersonii]